MLNLAAIKEAYFNYLELSGYLFGKGDKGIYDINEMSKAHKFYKHAREIAAQLEIDWSGMTHEESNRIMLALLEDLYQEIGRTVPSKDKKHLVLEVTFKIIK